MEVTLFRYRLVAADRTLTSLSEELWPFCAVEDNEVISDFLLTPRPQIFDIFRRHLVRNGPSSTTHSAAICLNSKKKSLHFWPPDVSPSFFLIEISESIIDVRSSRSVERPLGVKRINALRPSVESGTRSTKPE